MVDQAGDGDIADAKRSHIRRWRAKAAELRVIADGMKNDHRARRLMLNAAENYDRLADEADRPEASRSPPEPG